MIVNREQTSLWLDISLYTLAATYASFYCQYCDAGSGTQDGEQPWEASGPRQEVHDNSDSGLGPA